jgi:hypothetical protein
LRTAPSRFIGEILGRVFLVVVALGLVATIGGGWAFAMFALALVVLLILARKVLPSQQQ